MSSSESSKMSSDRSSRSAERKNKKLLRKISRLKKKIKKGSSTRRNSTERKSRKRRHRSNSRDHRSYSYDRDETERTQRGSSARNRNSTGFTKDYKPKSKKRHYGGHGRESSACLESESSYSNLNSPTNHHRRHTEGASVVDQTETNNQLSQQTEQVVDETQNSTKKSVLDLLGEDPSVNNGTGPPIHAALVDRWSKILKKGLSKDIKKELFIKYPPSGNCHLLQAPKLNPEVKSDMSAVFVKKDGYQTLNQNQLGMGISALGLALSAILENNDSKTKKDENLITLLGDSGRILTDLFHSFSIARKYFIDPGLTLQAKTIASEAEIDTYLFGNNFSEQVKALATVAKSSKEISKFSSSSSSYPRHSKNDNRNTENRKNLNQYGPARKSYWKTPRGNKVRQFNKPYNKTSHR